MVWMVKRINFGSYSGRAVAEALRLGKVRQRRARVMQLREAYPVGAEYPRFSP